MNHVRRAIAFAILALVATALTGAQPAAAHGLTVQAATASSRQALPQVVDRPVLFAAATIKWWTAPVAGARCSSPFGQARSDGPSGATYYQHAGRDLARYEGAPVQAAANGTVIRVTKPSGYLGGYGYRVDIRHGKGQVVTRYAHLRAGSITVHVGQWVRIGTVIGRMGHTGWAYATHTHFEFRVNGVAVNPDRAMLVRGVRICK